MPKYVKLSINTALLLVSERIIQLAKVFIEWACKMFMF